MDLEEAFGLFSLARSAFAPSAMHLVPDIALLGFLNDIEENARAVDVLSSSHLPHRAFPNARAAYEAAQQALLLSSSDDYDLAGARAWVYYLRRDFLFASLPRPSHVGDAARRSAEAWYEGAFAEMKDLWETLAPGRGETLERARVAVEAHKGRPDNWAGVPIAPALAARLEALRKLRGKPPNVGTAQIYNAAYSALSRESHPRMRVQPQRVTRSPDGSVELVLPERERDQDATTVRESAASALITGRIAVAYRIQPPAT
jgi:hypothetical protein